VRAIFDTPVWLQAVFSSCGAGPSTAKNELPAPKHKLHKHRGLLFAAEEGAGAILYFICIHMTAVPRLVGEGMHSGHNPEERV
jgi:hypothetical protein